jgi:hypothetical protein
MDNEPYYDDDEHFDVTEKKITEKNQNNKVCKCKDNNFCVKECCSKVCGSKCGSTNK